MRATAVWMTVGGLVAGAAVAGGVAVASVPAPEGTVSACVSASGTVRVIDVAKRQRCTRGEKALTWATIRFRGAWSSRTTYQGGDVVTRGGSSFVAKSPSRGRTPTATGRYWGVLAAGGATGPAGPAGPAGATGPAGPAGATGPAGAPATTLWAVFNVDAGSAVLRRGSGVVGVVRNGPGRYEVRFNRVVNTCSVTANVAANVPAAWARGMTRSATGVGDVNFAGIDPDEVFVVVQTTAAEVDVTAGNVHVQVFC